MTDRDSLFELFHIVSNQAILRDLPLTASALPYIRTQFGSKSDVYYRRRLSVCRMLLDIHLEVDAHQQDILLAAALSHSLPGDFVPETHHEVMNRLFASEPAVAEIMEYLRQTDYADKSYYPKLIKNRNALIIRLTERGVLVEALYEWEPEMAHRYINETREYFFPMCDYAKDHYPEIYGSICILTEKMKNLVEVNEVLLNRFEEQENTLLREIQSLKDDNRVLRIKLNAFSGKS